MSIANCSSGGTADGVIRNIEPPKVAWKRGPRRKQPPAVSSTTRARRPSEDRGDADKCSKGPGGAQWEKCALQGRGTRRGGGGGRAGNQILSMACLTGLGKARRGGG